MFFYILGLLLLKVFPLRYVILYVYPIDYRLCDLGKLSRPPTSRFLKYNLDQFTSYLIECCAQTAACLPPYLDTDLTILVVASWGRWALH